MRFPEACYQMLETLDTHCASCLRPAQRRGLACWVDATSTAQSAGQHQGIAALLPCCASSFNTLRQYLRDWLYDGQDPAASWHTQVEGGRCVVPLLRWVLSRALHQCGLSRLCDPRRLAWHHRRGEGCLPARTPACAACHSPASGEQC